MHSHEINKGTSTCYVAHSLWVGSKYFIEVATQKEIMSLGLE